ncbi:MAG: family 1 glycosylhydrolase, partial [Pseudomonadota bacterium]
MRCQRIFNALSLVSCLCLCFAQKGCNGKGEFLEFPQDFLWGTATAGFQVDMGCPSYDCDDTGSDWYQWATDEYIIERGLVNGDPPSMGPGHWELYESDFDLARDELSNNAFRMSIEWSRIFPDSTEDAHDMAALEALADEEAVAHYHDVLAAMKERGLTPLVTLNHYTIPLWMHDGVACYRNYETCENSGWLDGERLIPEIAKYAGYAAAQFGGEVDLWAT